VGGVAVEPAQPRQAEDERRVEDADAGDPHRARVEVEPIEAGPGALERRPRLREIAANPLLLTMIAMVHRYHGALPGSRVELYAEICEVLLGRWRQAKGVQDPLKTGQKLLVLRPLAAHMMERKLRDITAREALAVIAPKLRRVGVTGEAAKRFLSDLQESTGWSRSPPPAIGAHWSAIAGGTRRCGSTRPRATRLRWCAPAWTPAACRH
jgi:hypothetical protein